MIKLAKTAGFCFGVDRAVNLVYEMVEKGERVCTLGPIIHNSQLVADLEAKGVKIINSIDECPHGYTVVIRTHGVEKSVIDEAENIKVKYVNATCPFVSKIHKIVSEQQEGTVTLIAGDENHPEVLGIRSYCKGKSYVFKNAEELKFILENYINCENNSLVCVSQTTFSIKEWKKCEEILKKLYTNCRIYSTICNATADRQEEAANLSKEVDAMIVVGGRHSSNTCKLKDVCSANADTFLIETAAELKNIDLSGYRSVGVTAGASTPSVIIKEVLKTMSEEIIEKEVEATDAVAETADTADKAEKAAVKASADGEATFEEMLE
ncbi:MAG: 4-hydroxy-3-methylbut-2-enyl diphosphate reductase, partial [Eubacterium sp.]